VRTRTADLYRVDERAKIATTAGLLIKIWTEVISLISYSLVGISGVSLGQFLPSLEPVFEVIPKHSSMLMVDFLGPSEDLVNFQSTDGFWTGGGYNPRFGLMVRIDL
jgi:hypothetical protein